LSFASNARDAFDRDLLRLGQLGLGLGQQVKNCQFLFIEAIANRALLLVRHAPDGKWEIPL
jgi:hypothetical protein